MMTDGLMAAHQVGLEVVEVDTEATEDHTTVTKEVEVVVAMGGQVSAILTEVEDEVVGAPALAVVWMMKEMT